MPFSDELVYSHAEPFEAWVAPATRLDDGTTHVDLILKRPGEEFWATMTPDEAIALAMEITRHALRAKGEEPAF